MSKEVLQDKHVTALKEIGRSTAGVTLGSGEGGNAFGDRFFIRGFDARNDVFIDGTRAATSCWMQRQPVQSPSGVQTGFVEKFTTALSSSLICNRPVYR